MRQSRLAAVIVLTLLLGGALGAGLAIALRSHAAGSRWITLPTAYGSDNRLHVVDPLDCRVDDPGYSGRAVCSWVRNP